MLEFDRQGKTAKKSWIDAPESFRGWLLGRLPWMERMAW